MSKKIFAGNLPFSCSEEDIRDMFSRYGTVLSVKLIFDRETGRPRGFGFVEMESPEAEEAIEALNGTEFGGRNLRVDEATERQPREFSRQR